MSSTNYARNQILDYNFGSVAYSVPATFYLGLSTTTISSSGSNATEPSGASYARVSVTNNKTNFTYSASGCVVNATEIAFAESSGSWGTIVDVGLWDALSSGSIWYYTSLPTSKVVQTTTVVSFSASALSISMT